MQALDRTRRGLFNLYSQEEADEENIKHQERIQRNHIILHSLI